MTFREPKKAPYWSPQTDFPISLRTYTQNLLQSTLTPPRVERAPLYTNPLGTAREYPIQLRFWRTDFFTGLIPDNLHVPRAPLYSNPTPARPPLLWVTGPNLALLAVKLQLPPGENVTDLTPRSYEYHLQLRSWTASYNLNLIGQDKFPPGENITDLPPRQPYYDISLRTLPSVQQNTLPALLAPAVVTTYQIGGKIFANPIGPDYPISLRSAFGAIPPTPIAIPFKQTDWPINRGYEFDWRRSWDWKYNLNLIGKDQLPVGENVTDLPPQPYRQPAQSFIGQPPPAVAVAQPVGEIVTDLPPRVSQQPERTITAAYNPNLVGQDKLPVRQQDWPNPTQSYRAPELSTWIERVKLLLAVPFKQTDWPNPRTPQQPALGFTASYNLNLIGKDQLPVGENVTDLPPQPARRQVDVSNWINTVNLALTTVVAKLPFNQFDWPNPTAPFIQNDLRSWISQTGILLAPPPPPAQFQVGSKIFANPTGPHYPISLRSFFGAIPPPAAAKPFSQTDWPNPNRGPQQPDRSFGFVFARELIGKDRMTAGRQQDWPLPNRGPQQPAQSFTASYNQNLIGKDRMTAGRQQDWPNPNLGPMQPDRSFMFWPGAPYFPAIVPPPPSIGINPMIGAYPRWRKL